MNEELSEERNGLLSTVESLREKLNKAIASQQEIEAQRDRASENIAQVRLRDGVARPSWRHKEFSVMETLPLTARK